MTASGAASSTVGPDGKGKVVDDVAGGAKMRSFDGCEPAAISTGEGRGDASRISLGTSKPGDDVAAARGGAGELSNCGREGTGRGGPSDEDAGRGGPSDEDEGAGRGGPSDEDEGAGRASTSGAEGVSVDAAVGLEARGGGGGGPGRDGDGADVDGAGGGREGREGGGSGAGREMGGSGGTGREIGDSGLEGGGAGNERARLFRNSESSRISLTGRQSLRPSRHASESGVIVPTRIFAVTCSRVNGPDGSPLIPTNHSSSDTGIADAGIALEGVGSPPALSAAASDSPSVPMRVGASSATDDGGGDSESAGTLI